MRGQAFVTCPSTELADHALVSTFGGDRLCFLLDWSRELFVCTDTAKSLVYRNKIFIE